MLDKKIVEAEEDTYCTDDLEYNVPKYIEAFNNRIKPLLVCFSPEIRNKIIVSDPNKRQYFTESDSILNSGSPNKIEDQDTYEQLLTMEDKEIAYWKSINEIPTFAKELDLDWDLMAKEYDDRMEKLKDESICKELKKYEEIIENLEKKDVDDFIIDVKIPKEITDFLKLDVNTMSFISKEHNVKIGSVYDITDKEFSEDSDED